MDVQSKERLTGAVILVVLVVLVVPELLRGPRRAVEPAVPASAEGPPTRHYTIELGERSAVRPAQPQTPAAAQAPAPESAEQAPAAKNAVVERSAAHERRATESATESAPRVREAAAQPAPAVRPGAADPPPASGWSIQVGSFASRENADRLTRQLRQQGFRSFVAEGTSAGRRVYRVRVGPEADRASAQALAARLSSAGKPGSIVPHP